MYRLIADGIPWVDGDGNDTWTCAEASALADMLETRMGYTVDMVPV